MLKPRRAYEKGQSIQGALAIAGEREQPRRTIGPARKKRGATPSRDTVKRDSVVSQKLAALPRPALPPHRMPKAK